MRMFLLEIIQLLFASKQFFEESLVNAASVDTFGGEDEMRLGREFIDFLEFGTKSKNFRIGGVIRGNNWLGDRFLKLLLSGILSVFNGDDNRSVSG